VRMCVCVQIEGRERRRREVDIHSRIASSLDPPCLPHMQPGRQPMQRRQPLSDLPTPTPVTLIFDFDEEGG
jgi:hypothetical protein